MISDEGGVSNGHAIQYMNTYLEFSQSKFLHNRNLETKNQSEALHIPLKNFK